MKGAPIPLTLDLWALGHPAEQIVEMLGYPNRRHVERIVELARSIGDKRAVLHEDGAGRLIGRPGHMMIPPVAMVVPVIRKPVRGRAPYEPTGNRPGAPKKVACKYGHARTTETAYRSGGCKTCRHLKYRQQGE